MTTTHIWTPASDLLPGDEIRLTLARITVASTERRTWHTFVTDTRGEVHKFETGEVLKVRPA